MRINMPNELGGRRLHDVPAGSGPGAGRPRHQRLAWVVDTPAAWFPEVATPDQIERYVKPTIRGERQECYAITEENAGSDVGAIEATARRDGDEYVLNGVKWHVTSYNVADYIFFQGRLTEGPNAGQHGACSSSTWTRPGIEVVRVPRTRTRCASTTPRCGSPTCGCPAANLVGAEDDGMAYAYSWFRYERLMIGARCCGAPSG
jgi:alkylation response protein AidB-like acyl-CoA dehydrogenase